MPIYEYYCPDNNRIYSFFARSLELRDRIPRCPDNPDLRMEKVVSSFAVTRKTGAVEGEGAEPDLDDPRMEAAMAEMEQEMAGMDPDNPDPRQMARFMRRMQDMTGEKLPEQVQEMMGRMEAGESLEKLEEEYADVLDDENMGDFESSPTRRLLFQARRQPRRDPALYELTDYI